MSQSIVSTRGRVTIPADIRKGLGLKAQDRVAFTRLVDETVVMMARTRSVIGLRGLLERPKIAAKVPLNDMKTGRD